MTHAIKIISLTFFLLCFSTIATSAPEKNLWPRWTTNNAASTKSIDYAKWQDFLNRNVSTNANGINVIDYAAITPKDKKMLKQTIQTLAAIPIDKYNRKEQRAYWINLYNALTVLVVLDHYPVESIRDINLSSGFFNRGPWDAKLITVEGEQLSLNDIEHRILRPIWNDPRIHYALNCGSMGCPNLLKTAYTAKNTDQLLNQNAKDFVNSPRGAFINDKDQLVVSSIYIWYQADFGGSDPGVIAELQKYANPDLKKALEGRRKIDKNEYDWSLNEGRP